MSKLKDDLNKLFEEIRKAENECNFAKESELTDVMRSILTDIIGKLPMRITTRHTMIRML